MKTYVALLIMTDGRPVMNLTELGKLLGREVRTLQNKVYNKTLPFPTFKLDGEMVAHVEDVAAYIDAQRAAAIKELEDATTVTMFPRSFSRA